MSSDAASNAGACVSAPQAQAQKGVQRTGVPHVLTWEASAAQPMGAASAKSVPLAHSNPQPTETLDERELKRLRRKQNNRESARRSRQRKADENSQLAEQVSKRNADVLLLQATVKVLAQHVRDLSSKVREMGGDVDPSIDAVSDVSRVIAQTTQNDVHVPQSTASEAALRDSEEQAPEVAQAVSLEAAVPGMVCQQVDPAPQPAADMNC